MRFLLYTFDVDFEKKFILKCCSGELNYGIHSCAIQRLGDDMGEVDDDDGDDVGGVGDVGDISSPIGNLFTCRPSTTPPQRSLSRLVTWSMRLAHRCSSMLRIIYNSAYITLQTYPTQL